MISSDMYRLTDNLHLEQLRIMIVQVERRFEIIILLYR